MTGSFGTVTKGLLKGLEDLEVRGTRGHDQNYCNFDNGQNTEKSPGDMRRLAVTQTNTHVKNSKGGHIKREKEYLLVAAQNNAIRTNHIISRRR